MNEMDKKIIDTIKCVVETEMLSGTRDLPLRAMSGKIDKLKEKLSGCQRCVLAETRENVVFGEGSLDARLMFVGEAPGSEEDKQARPFVGRAGKLLTKMIESLGLAREEVYIANILKCRPPGNRNPSNNEISECIPFLREQVETISPRVICSLGKFASQTLLNTDTPISKLRGNFHEYSGIKLMPTYHPAYLLRNPRAKKDVWKDLKKIAALLGLEITSAKRTKNR